MVLHLFGRLGLAHALLAVARHAHGWGLAGDAVHELGGALVSRSCGLAELHAGVAAVRRQRGAALIRHTDSLAAQVRLAHDILATRGAIAALHVTGVPLRTGAAEVRHLAAVLRQRLPALVLDADGMLTHTGHALSRGGASLAISLPLSTLIAALAGSAVLGDLTIV